MEENKKIIQEGNSLTALIALMLFAGMMAIPLPKPKRTCDIRSPEELYREQLDFAYRNDTNPIERLYREQLDFLYKNH